MAITVPNDPDQPADEAATKSRERRALSVACGAHVLHDGYTDLIWIALPIWQAEFGLSYAAVGLLRMIYSGTMASLQIPASYIAGHVGGRAVLAAGTGLCGLCYCLAGSVMDIGRWWRRCFSAASVRQRSTRSAQRSLRVSSPGRAH